MTFRVIQFWILDFGFWIDSTDKSGGLYHQGIIGYGKNPVFQFVLQWGSKVNTASTLTGWY
ncbi:hypothetical protein FDUTEX481_10057 [Tolypothrix sp. PCC 7601]|nr:hypothetical protein FDUTEX481_10057 [Tolypothrix sp. PCC 7601]